MTTIDYSPLPGLRRSVLMPMLPVVFHKGKSQFSTYALVDSGATTSVISTVIAEGLGVEWNKIPTQVGMGVASTFRLHRTKLDIQIFNNKFSLYVNIVEGTSAYQCILGKADIFNWAKIILEGYKKKFHIEFREFN